MSTKKKKGFGAAMVSDDARPKSVLDDPESIEITHAVISSPTHPPVVVELEPEPEPEIAAELAAPPNIGDEGPESETEIAVDAETAIGTTDLSSVREESRDQAAIDAFNYGVGDVAKQIEELPREIPLPEASLPVGTEIVVEKLATGEFPGLYTFKIPGRNVIQGKGRTIAGAMLDAGIIR